MEWFIIIFIVVLLVLAYGFYVGLITKRNRALEALSGIDVQLNLRSDSVPNLLKIARRYMEHEEKLLEEISALRAQAGRPYNRTDQTEVQAHLNAASQLEGKISQLLVTVENYPELKADGLLMQTMESYNQVESHVAAARRFYNSAVSELNTATQIFPLSLIASMAGIQAMPFFEASEAARAPVDADRYLR